MTFPLVVRPPAGVITYSPSAISGATGSNIGDMTAGGGLAAAFNSTTSQSQGTSAGKENSTSAYVGKSYSPAKRIYKSISYGSNNQGYIVTLNSANTHIQLYAKTGSAPSSDTDGTLLGSVTITDTANESGNPREATSSDFATAWDHVWIRVTRDSAASTDDWRVAEVTFYEAIPS